MDMNLRLSDVARVGLPLMGEAALLGVTPAGVVYVEAYSDDQDEAAVWRVSANDEPVHAPLTDLPQRFISPVRHDAAEMLHFVGARWRGLRDEDRVASLVQPLSIAAKMTLIARLSLDVMPPMLLGVLESRVRSVCEVADALLVCRTVRLALALPDKRLDEYGAPYDYDSLALNIFHPFDAATLDAPELVDCIEYTRAMQLVYPLDCVAHDEYVYILDAVGQDESAGLVILKAERAI